MRPLSAANFPPNFACICKHSLPIPPTLHMIRFAIQTATAVYVTISLVLIGSICQAEEPPQITRLEPNSVLAGQVMDVRIVGQFKTWPVQVWSGSPHVTWSCKPESGVFQVAVDSSANLKEVWFRLFNSAGATPPRRLLIGTQQPILEKEPNDRLSQANDINLDGEVTAVLEKNVDVDCFRVHLSEGDHFSAVVDSHRYGSPVDANLQLLDEKGFVIAESIDHFGLDPAISATVTRTGGYHVKVFAFPAEPDSTISFRGGADWWYRLRCRKGDLLHELPPDREKTLAKCTRREIVAGLKLENAVALNLEEKVFQIVDVSTENSDKRSSQSHYYKLPKAVGTQVRLEVTAQSMGSPLDPTLTIMDATSKQHAFQDDAGNDRDASLTWTIPDDKDYFAVIGDFHRRGGQRHAYWLSLTPVQPRVHVTTSSDAYASKINQETEISMKLEKPAEWVGEIEVISSDASLGVVFAPSSVKIEKGTKDISVKLTATKAYAGLLPIQLKQKESGEVLSMSGPIDESIVPWLTVSE